MEILDIAYQSAVAVLTAPVSFAEWTTLKIEHRGTPNPDLIDDWSPIGLSYRYKAEDYTWDPAQKIEGERYIYVFAKRLWSEDALTLVEELKLTADGTIYAAQMGARQFPGSPLDDKNSPLPEKRTWDKVGSTIRFVRRLRGARLVHYFFSTRMPLERKFVEELRKQVRIWVPETLFDDFGHVLGNQTVAGVPNPTTFGEWDPNLVTGLGPGALQVPVLDPLTIALHLHDLAISASWDLYNYMTIFEGQSQENREKVIKRQQKFVLASVIGMVLKSNKTTAHDAEYNASQYLRDYQEQNQYRIHEMERWWRYLANWYQAGPLEFLSRVHFEHADDNRFSFFLPMLYCLLEANSSAVGRAMLADLAKQKNWLYYTVMPKLGIKSEEDVIADRYQIPRKFALAVLEVLKEFAPHLHHDSTAAMWQVLGGYSKHFHVRFFVDGAPMDEDPMVAAKNFKASMKKLDIEVPDAKEIVAEWHELASPGYAAKHRRFMGVLEFNTMVEVLDLVLSLRQFLNDRSFEHGLTLARSAADTTALLLEFAHGGRGKLAHFLLRLRPGIIIVAAIIEGYLGMREYWDSEEKHDPTGMTAAGFKVAGAVVTAAGVVAWVAFGLTTTPFFVAGLILMGIGEIISLFKDSPLDKYLKFCAFGDNGGGGEIIEGFEQLKKGEYGQHLEILLNMICRFKCELSEDARTLRISMGWVPEGAKLPIRYDDKWRFGSEYFNRKGIDHGPDQGKTGEIRETLAFGKGGVSLDGRQQFALKLSTAPYEANESPYSVDFDFYANFTAQLRLELGDFKFEIPTQPQVFTLQRSKGVPPASVLPD